MSNNSTKSGSSKYQKGIGSSDPDINIVDTSNTTSRASSSFIGKPQENVNVKYIVDFHKKNYL